MDIPSGVLAQFSDSVDRTGLTLALTRAYDVLCTLLTLPPDTVEELFMAAGQVEFMSAASLSGMRETPDECVITKDTTE